jgi:2-methylcitrate dehydratase PrpD
MPTTNVAERLAADCADRSADDLDDDVRERLKCHLLDWVGVAIGGNAHAESTDAIRRAVDAVAGEGDAATAIGADTLPVEAAALQNGALAHSLDYDDTHRESSLHPAAPVVAAALAMGEREDISGDRLLVALGAGYDVTCDVGVAVNPNSHYDRGFHVTATCGTFGATAAAAVVGGLDTAELTDAFGVNGSQAAGSLQFLSNGAWNKRLHPGLAARQGVLATELGRAGFRGAATPFEGEHGFFQGYSDDPDPAVLDDPRTGGEAVLKTALKPYPCCRYMHPALDALVELASEVEPPAVDRIVVDLPKPGVTLTGDPIEAKRRPENFVDCQFSMPFAAALALTRGEAGLAAFLDAQSDLDDPVLRHLMDAVEVVTTDDVMADFPAQWPARVDVEGDGFAFERRVDEARGEPEKPLTWDDTVEKFEEVCATASVPEGPANDLRRIVRDVGDHDVRELGDALRRATAGSRVPADD